MRLMGIGEEEEADLGRRGFLKMLGGAAVVAAAPTYVFAPSGGWNKTLDFSGGMTMAEPIMFMESTAGGLNWFDLNPKYKSIMPLLVDNFFKETPILTQIRHTKGRGWLNV